MKILKHARGTTAQNDAYVGANGSLTHDTERDELRLHDGNTPGGHRILNLLQLFELFLRSDSEFGDVQFSPEEKGMLTRIDNKTWALRALQAGNGITVSNSFGTTGNPVISVSSDYVAGIADGLLARRMHSFVTSGTPEAFTIDLTGLGGWSFGDGVFLQALFHAQPVNGATIKVGNLEPTPILMPSGSPNIADVIPIGVPVLLMLAYGSWRIVNSQVASQVPIGNISGLNATNVQTALEALRAQVAAGAGGGGGIVQSQFYSFGALTDHNTTLTQANVPLEIGQYRIIEQITAPDGPAGGDYGPTFQSVICSVLARTATQYYIGELETTSARYTFPLGSGVTAYSASNLYKLPSTMNKLGEGLNFSIPRVYGIRYSAVGTPVAL